MADMLEIANEVQETLGRTYGMPDDLDEADLEAGTVYEMKAHSLPRLTYTGGWGGGGTPYNGL